MIIHEVILIISLIPTEYQYFEDMSTGTYIQSRTMTIEHLHYVSVLYM